MSTRSSPLTGLSIAVNMTTPNAIPMSDAAMNGLDSVVPSSSMEIIDLTGSSPEPEDKGELILPNFRFLLVSRLLTCILILATHSMSVYHTLLPN